MCIPVHVTLIVYLTQILRTQPSDYRSTTSSSSLTSQGVLAEVPLGVLLQHTMHEFSVINQSVVASFQIGPYLAGALTGGPFGMILECILGWTIRNDCVTREAQ